MSLPTLGRSHFSRRHLWLLLSILLVFQLTDFLLAEPTELQRDITTDEARCVLQVNVEATVMIKIDGRDFGQRRCFVFEKLEPGKSYQAKVELHYPDNHSDSWNVPIMAGRMIQIGIEPRGTEPVQAKPTVASSPSQHSSEVPPPKSEPLAHPEPDASVVAAGCNAFGLDLYQQLARFEQNLVFSPASLQVALAMTSAGATGTTQAQMIKALHLPQDLALGHAGLSRLLQAWNLDAEGANESAAARPYELAVANSLWVQQGLKLQPGFLQLCQTHYAAGLQQIDFLSPQTTSAAINHWIGRQTHGKITELVSPAMLPEATRLLLANGIYFKGKWLYPFSRRQTATVPFHISEKRISQVSMMHLESRVNFYADTDWQLVELPYAGDRLSMVVLLPAEPDGLKGHGKQLTFVRLMKMLDRLHLQRVDVSLPKFRMESQLQLVESLRALGMNGAFTPGADFSGITGASDLQLADVVHRTEIELNEKGTEAAAATAVVTIAKTLKVDPPVEFRADHPFLFLIRDRKSHTVLFLGHVVEPKS